MKQIVWSFVLLLLVFHQDYWQWGNSTIDFGFMPRSLTYHVGISIVAAFVWLLATKFCWPEGIDEVASAADSTKQEDASA